MIPYLLLLVLPLFAYFVCIQRDHEKKPTLLIGYHGATDKRNLALPTFYCWLIILLVCRADTVGRDLADYSYIFWRDGTTTVAGILAAWDDPVFKLFNHAFYSITDNYQWYLAVTALLSVIPLAYVYCMDRSHAFLKITLFLNMSTFWFLFSGIRQSIAIALGVVCFLLLQHKKKVWFFAVATVAVMVHSSGFMVLALFPLYYARFKRKHLFFVLPITAVVFLFNRQIFAVLTGLFAGIYGHEIITKETGAFNSLILFAIFAVLSYLLTDDEKMGEDDYALRNFLLMAVWLQCFAPLHSLAMRMNYYFIIFIPMAMGRSFSVTNKQFANAAKWIEMILCLFFAAKFCIDLYNSLITGRSALDTIPYVPFWAE